MKNAMKLLVMFLFLAISFSSCKHETQTKKYINPSFSTYQTDSTGKAAEPKTNDILYGLITPTEITTIFSRLRVPYNDDILNPISNKDLYTSSSKASINLGIYGVDFGYIKMFGIGQKMIYYIQTVLSLSNKLGIPDQFLMEPLKKMQSDMSSPDTIMTLVQGYRGSSSQGWPRKHSRTDAYGRMG
jgi:hypothetical protein